MLLEGQGGARKRRRTYTTTDQALALAMLDSLLKGRTRSEATPAIWKEAAKLADVEEDALRFWATDSDAVDVDEAAREALEKSARWDGVSTPMPPSDMQNPLRYPNRLVPAPEMFEWAMETFIRRSGDRFHPVHSHLAFATIGVVWSNYPLKRNGKMIAGTAEMLPKAKGPRPAHREDFQMRSWFGQMPQFLITLDSVWWAQAPELGRCATMSHELCHCGQAKDEYGAPKWTKRGPKFALIPHDGEEFIPVMEDYGIDHAAAGVAELLEAALRPPRFGNRSEWVQRGHCGVCGR